MGWSKQLAKLFVQGNILNLEAYVARLGPEIASNSHHPKRAARLQELTNSAGLMVSAIQKEATLMTIEDEAPGALISSLGGLAARRR